MKAITAVTPSHSLVFLFVFWVFPVVVVFMVMLSLDTFILLVTFISLQDFSEVFPCMSFSLFEFSNSIVFLKIALLGQGLV